MAPDDDVATCLDCGAELDDGWPSIGPYTRHRAEVDDDRPFCRACVKNHLYDYRSAEGGDDERR